MITTVAMGIFAAGLTLFLNYCIGKPGGEFSPYEIFSGYTVWLSKWRLKRIGLFQNYSEQYHDNLQRIKTKDGLITLKNDFKKIMYDAAEPFFTWERMIGMCSVCFGFWVSLGCGLFISKNIVDLLIIIVISHVSIRLLNKII